MTLGVPNNPTGSFDFDRMADATRVPNSVKYRSPDIGNFTFGGLYGFGGVPGSFPSNATVSFGANYANGPLGLGAAYVDMITAALQYNFSIQLFETHDRVYRRHLPAGER